MKLKITYYLDVASSWCFLAEPAWAALKERYAGRVDFEWKIALMDATGLPTSREQLAWFYRRSGMIMRSPFMLNTEWLQPGASEYPVRNFVAEAARDLGVSDDRVRLALATAVLRDGKQADQWEVAAEIGAQAGGLDQMKLLDCAFAGGRSRSASKYRRVSRAESDAAADLRDRKRDRRSRHLLRLRQIASARGSRRRDAGGISPLYESHAAHFGEPPSALRSPRRPQTTGRGGTPEW